MHMRATKHFQYGLLDPQRKEKKIKLFTWEKAAYNLNKIYQLVIDERQ